MWGWHLCTVGFFFFLFSAAGELAVQRWPTRGLALRTGVTCAGRSFLVSEFLFYNFIILLAVDFLCFASCFAVIQCPFFGGPDLSCEGGFDWRALSADLLHMWSFRKRLNNTRACAFSIILCVSSRGGAP